MKAEDANRIKSATLWGALAGFAILITTGAFYHEMWRDEVLALTIAKGMNSWAALVAQLPHEGHPILWYALLRLGYELTHSYVVLPVLALAIAFTAAYLILRHAPFPVWLRLLAVFGAFLGYELSVSARNYGIGVLLMVLSCIAYRRRHDRPLLPGVCLLLLANTSIHAALAALAILFYWALELLDSKERSTGQLAAFAIAVAGVAVAVAMSRPAPEMAWAVSVGNFDYRKVLAAIFIDPGKGLLGYRMASITAVSELPWRFTGIDVGIASRIIVDLCIGWLLWSLRKHRRALVVMIVSIIGFEIFFRVIYTASLRHEAIVLFLVFSLCWIESEKTGDSKRIAVGLLPLFALQAIALPFVVYRTIRYPESSSKAYGHFIRANPRYANAILMSEPDYLMESMPYYVTNPIFMPRQSEFTDRVFFDTNGRRRADLTLGQLITTADDVSCSGKRPVLIAIGYPDFQTRPNGVGYPAYRGLTFTWTEADWARLGGRAPVASFPIATSDETYSVYEIGCR